MSDWSLVSRSSTHGTLARGGKVWRLPVWDRPVLNAWQVLDELFIGDRLEFPNTRRGLLLRVTFEQQRLFQAPGWITSSITYHLPARTRCPHCRTLAVHPITITDGDHPGRETWQFTRTCQCGHTWASEGRSKWWAA